MAALADASCGTLPTHPVAHLRKRAGSALLEQLTAARTSGDERAVRSAEHRVISEFRPLADRLAFRFRGRGVEEDDLLQLARLGLIKAVRRWSPEASTGLVQFAMPTIEGEIKRYFRDHCRPIRMPRQLQGVAAAARQAEDDLRHELGRSPSDEEIAGAASCTPALVREQRLARAVCQPASIDGLAPSSALAVRCVSTERQLERVDELVGLQVAMRQLTARERLVIRLRFLSDMTQSQIATSLGISQMHVSRLLRGALRTLRTQMASRPPDGLDAMVG